MRITGGTLRGRTLNAPEGLTTRPTTDRVREALFNILAHRDWGEEIGDPLEDAVVLDAFAGTGALGLEALSRGASFAFFFEKDRKALQALHENVTHLKVEDATAIVPMSVTKPPVFGKKGPQHPCSLVFLDPPYRKGLIPEALAGLSAQGWLAPKAMFVMETAKNETRDLPADFALIFERTYGATTLSFYRAN